MTRSAEQIDTVPMTPEEYAKNHQQSFRAAFDFLASHFPPGMDPDWWVKTGQDVTKVSVSLKENKLLRGLLVGVYEYLEEEFQKRRDGLC